MRQLDQKDNTALILEQLTQINQGIKDLNDYYKAKDQQDVDDAAARAAAADKKAEEDAAAKTAADAQLVKDQEAKAKADADAKKLEDDRYDQMQKNQEATNDLLVTISDGIATISSKDDTDLLEGFKQQNDQLIANTTVTDPAHDADLDNIGFLANASIIFFVLGLIPIWVFYKMAKSQFRLLNNIV